MDELIAIARQRKAEGHPIERDVFTHAAMLVGNGWAAGEAVDESQRTLDNAEIEGAY